MQRVVFIIAFMIGLFLPLRLFDETFAQLTVTFIGLVAAGLFPAMPLLVGNVLTGSRSVARLMALKEELDRLLNQMFRLLAILALCALLTIIHQLDIAAEIPAFTLYGNAAPQWLLETPGRILQASILVLLALTLDRTRLIKTAFKTVLNARYELAIADSKKRLNDRAPTENDVEKTFTTPPNFASKA